MSDASFWFMIIAYPLCWYASFRLWCKQEREIERLKKIVGEE